MIRVLFRNMMNLILNDFNLSIESEMFRFKINIIIDSEFFLEKLIESQSVRSKCDQLVLMSTYKYEEIR